MISGNELRLQKLSRTTALSLRAIVLVICAASAAVLDRAGVTHGIIVAGLSVAMAAICISYLCLQGRARQATQPVRDCAEGARLDHTVREQEGAKAAHG